MMDDIKKLVIDVINNKKGFGLQAFVTLKQDERVLLKKFVLDDDLLNKVKIMFKGILNESFFKEEVLIGSIEDIADKRLMMYEIIQNDSFRPFNFEEQKNVSESYSESFVDDIIGFAFRFNINNKYFWIYQHICYSQLVKRSKNIYAILSPMDVYKSLDRDIIKIESKVDAIIVNDSILTSKIELLERNFGFAEFIRTEAAETIKFISQMDIVDNVDLITKFEDKKSLTNAKKILKARKSPVLRMDKKKLLDRIQVHPRYNCIIVENDRICLETQKDVLEFLKMLNDSILKSELTDAEYDSTVKKELEPITR